MKEIMILRREQATSAATSFFESFADEVGSGVGRRLHPFLADGEEPLDFRLGLRLTGRFVQAGFDGLHRASGAHLGARAANVQPRQELKEASEEVASRLVFARELMRGFYGPKAANRILGLSGRTPTADQPLLLWRHGRDAARRLRTADVGNPPRLSGLSFDPQILADELEAVLERLAQAMKAADLERARTTSIVADKAAALKQFDVDYRDAIRFAVGFCRMAGRPDLASAIRAEWLKGVR